MRFGLTSTRPARFDELGLRRAVAGRTVAFLSAVMAFLAALAIAGWIGATALAGHWDNGAGATLTVQVPTAEEPAATGNETRLAAVLRLLRAAPGVESATKLSDRELDALLRPWLGVDVKTMAMRVPAVISVHMTGVPKDLDAIATQLAQGAPGTILEDHAVWAGRLGTLARSLRRCAGLALAVVILVAVAVIAVATRQGLTAGREVASTVYQLGATEGYIVRRFAERVALLAAVGGLIGGVLAPPAVFALEAMAAPLAGRGVPALTLPAIFAFLPLSMWLLPAILPAAAGIISYLTTQLTMRRWLRHLL